MRCASQLKLQLISRVASQGESLILNHPANGSVMQALIIQCFAVNGGSDNVHTEKCQDNGEISSRFSR
jgi:hypothetical protein